MSGRISDINEIFELLARAYAIETRMEKASQWDAYVRISEQCRETLVELSNDCVKHAQTLRDLAVNLGGFDIDSAAGRLAPMKLDIEGKGDPELFAELRKVEEAALELYSKLHASADPAIVEKKWAGSASYMEFFVKVRSIINDEERHVRIVTEGHSRC